MENAKLFRHRAEHMLQPDNIMRKTIQNILTGQVQANNDIDGRIDRETVIANTIKGVRNPFENEPIR